MSDPAYVEFLASIEANLRKHGFPGKRVALPLERMYEVAHGKSLNFNKALTMLADKGIAHEKTNDKVIFFVAPDPLAQAKVGPGGDLVRQAQEMLATMSPEQIREIETLYANMSDEQKAQIMARVKDAGLL